MKRVLFAALDWGLGHATRSVPVIQALQQHGCEVLLAGSGDSLLLLRKEFPSLHYVDLPGYAPRYPSNGRSMVTSMALQLPRFISVVNAEHRALKKLVAREHIDLVISDNRYGCWSPEVHSVFITHQSNILMPRRFGFLQGIVRRFNASLMNRFDECWIPDIPPGESLAGDLADFGRVQVKNTVRYIGLLSRFKYRRPEKEPTLDVLAIFSGPEPQRTVLEQIVLPQLMASSLNFRVVRGLPAIGTDTGDKRIDNFLPARELQSAIESALVVIARSGYSTVMDMKALGKQVIFIPTPGQTEQEYLAERLRAAGVAFSTTQNEFNLGVALQEAKRFSGFTPVAMNELLNDVIRQLIKNISGSNANERTAV